MNVDYMAYMPSVVFIDGEYWGIHNLRERQDEYYIQSNHGIDVDSFDIIEYAKMDGIAVEAGDMQKYNEMVCFIENNELSMQQNFDSLKTMIDVENVIDFFIAQLFLGNRDFPDLNVALWRPKTENGRFRYFFFDCDACMVQANYNLFPEFTKYIDDLNNYPPWSSVIFAGLLKNSEFRQTFYNRFLYLLQTDFSAESLLSALDMFEKTYESLVGEHVIRWQKPTDVQKWKDNVNKLRKFAIQRPGEVFAQLQELFHNPFTVYPNPSKGDFEILFHNKIDEQVLLKIYDVQGKLLNERKLDLTSILRHRGSHDLKNGMYLLVVETSDYIFTQKLIVH